MSTTITDKDVHVSCSDFCGLPITETGEAGKAQHATDCGAGEADWARLDGELIVARTRAANSEEAEPEKAAPPQFRCECGVPYDSWEELGQHQTGMQHTGMWTGEATVDGKPANIVHDDPQQPLLQAPVTDESVLGNLARAMEAEAALRTAANTAKNALAHAVKKTKAAAEFAAHHWAQSRQVAMNLTSGGTEPDDDDDEAAE